MFLVVCTHVPSAVLLAFNNPLHHTARLMFALVRFVMLLTLLLSGWDVSIAKTTSLVEFIQDDGIFSGTWNLCSPALFTWDWQQLVVIACLLVLLVVNIRLEDRKDDPPLWVVVALSPLVGLISLFLPPSMTLIYLVSQVAKLQVSWTSNESHSSTTPAP